MLVETELTHYPRLVLPLLAEGSVVALECQKGKEVGSIVVPMVHTGENWRHFVREFDFDRFVGAESRSMMALNQAQAHD
jgi:hypothetical protein